MKKTLSFLLAIAFIFSISQFGYAKSNKILAIVNGDVISQVDVEDRVKMAIKLFGMQDTAQNRASLREQMLKSVINETLQLQTAEKLKIKVTDDQIQQALRNFAAQQRVSVEALKTQLRKQGISMNAIQQQMKAGVAWSILVRDVYGSQLHVSQQEIDNFLKNVKEQEKHHQRHLAEIVLPFGGKQKEEKVKAQAQNLVHQIRNGANFENLAKQFSSSPTSLHGGDIGWVRKGALDSAIEKAIDKLPTNKVSDPIRTSRSYHILLIKGKRQPGAQFTRRISLHQLAAPLPAQATEEDLHFNFSRMEHLTDDISSLSAFKKTASENKDLVMGSMNDIDFSDLPRPLQKIVATLKVNKPSKPIHSEDGVTVLFLSKDQKEQIKITKDDAYTTIANNKLERIAKRAFGDIYKKSYIDIKS